MLESSEFRIDIMELSGKFENNTVPKVEGKKKITKQGGKSEVPREKGRKKVKKSLETSVSGSPQLNHLLTP